MNKTRPSGAETSIATTNKPGSKCSSRRKVERQAEVETLEVRPASWELSKYGSNTAESGDTQINRACDRNTADNHVFTRMDHGSRYEELGP